MRVEDGGFGGEHREYKVKTDKRFRLFRTFGIILSILDFKSKNDLISWMQVSIFNSYIKYCSLWFHQCFFMSLFCLYVFPFVHSPITPSFPNLTTTWLSSPILTPFLLLVMSSVPLSIVFFAKKQLIILGYFLGFSIYYLFSHLILYFTL